MEECDPQEEEGVLLSKECLVMMEAVARTLLSWMGTEAVAHLACMVCHLLNGGVMPCEANDFEEEGTVSAVEGKVGIPAAVDEAGEVPFGNHNTEPQANRELVEVHFVLAIQEEDHVEEVLAVVVDIGHRTSNHEAEEDPHSL